MNRIEEASLLLTQLGFDAERSNERSARVLLALLKVSEDTSWADATNEMQRTRDVMDWIRDVQGHEYKANTRETIRRFTLHQFIEAGLVEENADQPDRAVNSPKWNYRVTEDALRVIRLFMADEQSWIDTRDDYLKNLPGLVSSYARSRDLLRIPLTLPDSREVKLSPGGQNVLMKDMVEEFCPRYTPGAELVYIGDAKSKWAHFDEGLLASLGVSVDSHGKMPDLVVYQRDKNWLFLMEACSSHGPVDAKRYRELHELFANCTAGLVLVSCFPTRAVMRQYLADIAWETEAWSADAPDHMMHFNGSRFLGPYEVPENMVSVDCESE